MARPTEYDPSYCEMVIGWGAKGKSLTWMAAELDVSRECVYEWARVHPEFSDALMRARAKAQQWWEDSGQNALMAPGFNSSVWAKSMAARFPDDWRDNNKVEVTGANGGPVATHMTIEFVDAGSVSE